MTKRSQLGSCNEAGDTTTNAPATAPAAALWKPPASFSEWAGGLKYAAQIDARIFGNPQSPNDGVNYGSCSPTRLLRATAPSRPLLEGSRNQRFAGMVGRHGHASHSRLP